MTGVEVIALVLVLLGAVKIGVLAVNPSVWYNEANPLVKIEKNTTRAAIFALIVGGVVLYYLLQELTFTQIFATTAFVWALFVLTLAPFSTRFLDLGRQMAAEPGFFRRNWLGILVWVILTVWVLVEIF